jgi:serine/threonine protein kinase
VSQRSFEGYRYGAPLEAEFYGNLYRAHGPSGAEVRLLEVKPTFAAHQELATTLLARGKLLYNFEHENVVRTHAVGRAEHGGLVVVTDAVPGRVRLDELLGGVTDAEMRALPKPVAVAMSLAVLEALAAAHDRSVVHGALHPRSVVADGNGTVKVDDFAVGRALATWSERDSAASFVKAFGGFLAPELAQGARPDASTDVYGAAVLVLAMATGRTAAVALAQGVVPPAMTAVLARALDTNRLHRYANAKRLRDALKAAWQADGWSRATTEELRAFIERRRGPGAPRPPTVGEEVPDQDLEKDTEDVLSFLGDIATPPPAAPELLSAVNSMLAELDDDDEAEATRPVAVPALALPAPPDRIPRASSADLAMTALSDLDDDDEPETEAAARPAAAARSAARAKTGPAAEPKVSDSTPLPGSPGRSPSDNVVFAALSDTDDGSFSSSRLRDSVTPLPEPIRPSSEDIAFAVISQLEDDDEPASPAAMAALARSAPPAPPRPALPPPSPRPGSSQSSAPASPRPGSAPASPRPGSEKSMAQPDERPRPAKNRSASARVASQDPSASSSGRQPKRSSKGRPSASTSAAAAPASALVAAVMPPLDVQAPDLSLGSRRGRGLRSLLWAVLIAAAAGILVWVVRNQMALREQAEQQAQANEARQKELLREHMAAQPKSGRILIESEPAEAAVWMLLGRTPLQTEPLSAAMVHELRLELDGYQPQDVRVSGAHWQGDKEVHAEVTARLRPGTLERPLPAYPPEPPAEAMEGLHEGQGPVRIVSEPPGAQVWLLVGITPGVEVMATAGAEYELEVVKDGHVPGIVVVRADDWKKGEGQTVAHSVELKRQPKKR